MKFLNSLKNLVCYKYGRELMTLSDERHNMLLVVAVLLITITYQAVLSPVGDFGKMMITSAIPQKQGQRVLVSAMPQLHTTQGHRLL